MPASYREAIDKGISTGWKCLDKFMQGLRPGEVTVITADTGAGKTTFAMHLCVNACMQGAPVWLNSWEMRPEVVMRKVASVVLRKPLKYQDFTAADSDVFDSWAAAYPLYVNPHTIGTDIKAFAALLAKASELGVKVVLIDHLDYLVSNKREKLHECIDEAVKQLHELAFDLRMHFLLICHPRQTATNTEEVGLHSLKGSSSIKQYADNIITLHRCARTDSTETAGKVKVCVVKNRMFGIEGKTYLFYQPQWDGYLELNDFMENKNED